MQFLKSFQMNIYIKKSKIKNGNMEKAILLLSLVAVLAPGCTSPPADNPALSPKEACIQLCLVNKANMDLSSGPCLSNEISPGWVCDVAHSPRASVDNLAENQCPAFGKTAGRFVEVDPECRFIREV